MRDLVIRGNSLPVVGTHGRWFWISDNFISSAAANQRAIAAPPAGPFKPGLAYRVRRNVNTDTPLPPKNLREKIRLTARYLTITCNPPRRDP